MELVEVHSSFDDGRVEERWADGLLGARAVDAAGRTVVDVMATEGRWGRSGRGIAQKQLTVSNPSDTVPTNFRRETPLAAMVAIVVVWSLR